MLCTNLKTLILKNAQSVREVSRKMGYHQDSLNAKLAENGNMKVRTLESLLNAINCDMIICARDTKTGEIYTLYGDHTQEKSVEPYEKRAKEPTWKNLLEKE